MNWKDFDALKEKVNSKGLTFTPGLTYENKELKKVFLGMQKLNLTFIDDNDLDSLKEYQVFIFNEAVKKIKKEISLLLGKEVGGNLQIIAQEFDGSEIKLFFETDDDASECLFNIKLLSKYFGLNISMQDINTDIMMNPIYGFTWDVLSQKLTNLKVYFETEESCLFSEKLLVSPHLYPYSVMYSFRSTKVAKKYEYWAFKKETDLVFRKQLTQELFGIDLPNLNPDLFDYKEFQYSGEDSKINFYFFDRVDKISKAINDE